MRNNIYHLVGNEVTASMMFAVSGWALAVFFGGVVLIQSKLISKLKSRITNMEDAISEAKTKISTAQNQIDTINSLLKTNEALYQKYKTETEELIKLYRVDDDFMKVFNEFKDKIRSHK